MRSEGQWQESSLEFPHETIEGPFSCDNFPQNHTCIIIELTIMLDQNKIAIGTSHQAFPKNEIRHYAA